MPLDPLWIGGRDPKHFGLAHVGLLGRDAFDALTLTWGRSQSTFFIDT